MVIHPKFTFIHFEKTGGSFIEDFLVKNIEEASYLRSEIVSFKDETYKKVCRHDNLYRFIFEPEIIKFGYIRNPYDWYLSLWSFSREKQGLRSAYRHLFLDEWSKQDVNHFIKLIFNNKEMIICYHIGTGALIDKFDNEFERHIDLPTASKLDIGLLTYKYLYMYYHPDVFNDIENYKEYKIVDKVLRFENLVKELDKFFEENIFRFNKHQKDNLYNGVKTRASKHEHYSKYYTKEIIDSIRHKDRIIFKEYNYEF